MDFKMQLSMIPFSIYRINRHKKQNNAQEILTFLIALLCAYTEADIFMLLDV